MHTNPSTMLAEPELGVAAQKLLRSCVHCGFCLPACPTYRVTGSELDSPRGRIYLIKQLVETNSAGIATRRHLDRCLTCRSCETACPSGVEYGRLLDIGRELVEQTAPVTGRGRWLRTALSEILSRRRIFGALLGAGRVVRRFLPRTLRKRIPLRHAPQLPAWPEARHSRRMIVLEGCVQPALAPGINVAAARVLDRMGVSLVRAPGETCCGALSHHLGRTGRALEQARRNIDACSTLLDAGAEAVVSTTSGCGVMVKDYAHLLRDDTLYVAKARRVAAATRDLSEVINADDLDRAGLRSRTGASVAWQAPCTLQHGQKINGRVEALLSAVGCRLTAVADPYLCCGSAGTYSILQPDLAMEVRARKLATLEHGAPEVIATANIGCLEHLRAGTGVPVKHWIEIVAASMDP